MRAPARSRYHALGSAVALSAGKTVPEQVMFAKRAEALGYRSVWPGEVTRFDAPTVMSALALSTATVTIGSGVMPIFFRSPYLTAMTVNALATLAPERLVLGLGVSTPKVVTDWHGASWHGPIDYMRRYVDALRRLLNGERVSSAWPVRIDGARLSTPGVSVPIYIAAVNDGMLRLAAEVADGVLLNFATPEYLVHSMEVLRTAADEHDRDPASIDVVGLVRASLGSSSYAWVRSQLLPYCLPAAYRNAFELARFGRQRARVTERWSEGDKAGALNSISDEMCDHFVLLKTDADARKRIEYCRSLGVTTPMIVALAPDTPDAFDVCTNTITQLAPDTGLRQT